MPPNEIEVITLSSIPFQEKSKIVKVYTDKRGMLSFFTNRISQKNSEMISFCSLCTLSEVIYLNKNSNLLKVKEVSIKNLFLPIRESLEKINAAIVITKAMLISQVEDKPNIILFTLLKKYLEKLSISLNPLPYASSFQLKILQLEGLINLNGMCSICNQTANYALKGAFFCLLHKNYDHIQFEAPELKILIKIATIKRFSELEAIEIAPKLAKKIQNLFTSCFN